MNRTIFLALLAIHLPCIAGEIDYAPLMPLAVIQSEVSAGIRSNLVDFAREAGISRPTLPC